MNSKKIILFFTLAVAASITFGNTSKYRLSWRDDPATTMVVGWNQDNGGNSILYYSDNDFGTNISKYKERKKESHSTSFGKLNSKFVRLTNLRPNTVYYFLIKDSNSTSKRLSFRTAPAKPQQISFIAGGDSRTNKDGRIKGNKLVAKLRPLFVMFGGDYMADGSAKRWAQWLDDWQETISEDGRLYPLLPAMGNHEYFSNHKKVSMLTKLFDIKGDNGYYALSFCEDMIRTYVLNSELGKSNDKSLWSAQSKWLMQDLSKHKSQLGKLQCIIVQ
jgi:hypothetical protein